MHSQPALPDPSVPGISISSACIWPTCWRHTAQPPREESMCVCGGRGVVKQNKRWEKAGSPSRRGTLSGHPLFLCSHSTQLVSLNLKSSMDPTELRLSPQSLNLALCSRTPVTFVPPPTPNSPSSASHSASFTGVSCLHLWLLVPTARSVLPLFITCMTPCYRQS